MAEQGDKIQELLDLMETNKDFKGAFDRKSLESSLADPAKAKELHSLLESDNDFKGAFKSPEELMSLKKKDETIPSTTGDVSQGGGMALGLDHLSTEDTNPLFKQIREANRLNKPEISGIVSPAAAKAVPEQKFSIPDTALKTPSPERPVVTDYENQVKGIVGKIQSNPNDAANYYELGNLHTEAGKTIDAQDIYQKGLEKDSQSPALNYAMGYSMYKNGDLKGAIAYFQNAAGENVRKRIRDVDPSEVISDEQEIADRVNTKITRTPTLFSDKAYNALATIYNQSGEYDKAITAADNALKVNPSSETALLTKGYALRAKAEKGDKAAEKESEASFVAAKKIHDMNVLDTDPLSIGAPGTKEYDYAENLKAISSGLDEAFSPVKKAIEWVHDPFGKLVDVASEQFGGAGEDINKGIEGARKGEVITPAAQLASGLLKGGLATVMTATPAGLGFTVGSDVAVPEQVAQIVFAPASSVLDKYDEWRGTKRGELSKAISSIADVLAFGMMAHKVGGGKADPTVNEIGKKILNREELTPTESAVARRISQDPLFQKMAVENIDKVSSQLPEGITDKQAEKILPSLIEINNLKEAEGKVHDVFKSAIKEKIKAKEKEIQTVLNTKENAKTVRSDEGQVRSEATPETSKDKSSEDLQQPAKEKTEPAETVEQTGKRPAEEEVTPAKKEEALKDVESTAKALDDFGQKANSIYETETGYESNPLLEKLDKFFDDTGYGGQLRWQDKMPMIAEAYHADKKAAKETEITKAVEDLLGKPAKPEAVKEGEVKPTENEQVKKSEEGKQDDLEPAEVNPDTVKVFERADKLSLAIESRTTEAGKNKLKPRLEQVKKSLTPEQLKIEEHFDDIKEQLKKLKILESPC